MANPDPEIWPPDATEVRPDAIIATGRSEFPNQVNNVLGFPFIFRGALDARASEVNEAMRTDGIVSDEQPVLLGTTGKFLFLYYPSRKATEIVPIDNTAVLTVDSRRRKDREADSLAKVDSASKRSAPEDSERDSMNPD